MKQIAIGPEKKSGSAVVQGCMRIANMSEAEADRLIKTDLENGITFFDHADVYTDGACEALFGKVLAKQPSLRDKITLQTKCGIVRGNEEHIKAYDFSKEHLLETVNASLKRLQTDHVDYLLLHRPDALVEPEEVAEAFDQLHSEGKVLHFGVSNQNPYQIELLKKYLHQPLEINQLQLSIKFTGMIDAGINVNMTVDGASDRDGSILDYCRLNDVTIQAWSPFQYGFFEGVFLDNPKFPELNQKIDEIAKKYGVSNNAIAVAWILRHPAEMQVILGTTNIDRVAASAKGAEITLTRQEWYDIYQAAGNKLP
ncbi:aldo/keto reductase [Sporolactobacillus inulinus]|uniref:Aldo/keto reductase n=1 Tax=Sporolactobacillus inulinus CASD TaxID=1069536 RepID=A0A0U1QSD5_9BACL|nr:aldo/keto reductase [Sporolactobacillus inulinus]KLI03710.1 aldo/keto reductase [Sporolactobacillus inulinus CASD]GEB77370.1 aldo/keto reductase [Sporolactobacillus inulinus]